MIRKIKEVIREVLKSFALGRQMYSLWWKLKSKSIVYVKRRRLRVVGPKALGKISKCFDEIGLQWFVDYGTLIGVAREGAFLKHDVDIDVSVMPVGRSVKQMISCLTNNGFRFLRAFEYEGQITELTVEYKRLPIDLFFCFFDNSGRMYTQLYTAFDGDYSAGSWGGFRNYRPNVNAFIELPFGKDRVKAPENYDEVLSRHYGNWRVPDNGWRFEKDGKSEVLVKLPNCAHVLRSVSEVKR